MVSVAASHFGQATAGTQLAYIVDMVVRRYFALLQGGISLGGGGQVAGVEGGLK